MKAKKNRVTFIEEPDRMDEQEKATPISYDATEGLDLDSIDLGFDEERFFDEKSAEDKKFAAICKMVEEQYAKDEADQAPYINGKLKARYDELRASGKSVDEFLKLGEDILLHHKKAVEEHTNTTRAKAEILAFEQGKKPKATELAKQFSKGSFVEPLSFEESVQADKIRKEPLIHTASPSANYRAHVFQAEKETAKDLYVNSRRMASFLDDGVDIPESEKRISQPSFEKFQRVAAGTTNLLTDVVGTLTKGILSSSDPRQSSEYKKMILDRNQKLAKKVAMLDPKKPNFADLLQECQDLMGGDFDINHALGSEMQALLTKWREGLNEADKKRLEQFDKDCEAWEKDMEKGNAANVDAADIMFKWRMLSLLLLVTPFAPLSLIGPIAGFLGPIVGSGGITQGILTVMGQFGPFSDLMHLMKMDVAVQAILNHTPILSDLIQVTDAVVGSAPIQQGFGMVAGAVIDSPLTGVALGAGVFAARLPTEMDHREKVTKLRTESAKKFDDIVSKFEKDRNAGMMEAKTADGAVKSGTKGPADFAKEALKIRQDKNIPIKMAKFLVNEKTPQAIKDKLCKDFKLKKNEKEEDLGSLIKGQSFNTVYDMMAANEEIATKMKARFLEQVARDKNVEINREKSAEMLKKGKLYKNPEYRKEELLKQGEAILAKELAREMAREIKAKVSEVDSIEALESAWVGNRESYIKKLDKSAAPSSKIKPKGYLGKGLEVIRLFV